MPRPLGQSGQITSPPGTPAPPPAPVVLSIVPTFGTTAGATAVTIHGNNFLTATSAAVGGVNIGAFHVVDDHNITGTTGAHAQGDVNVTVTSPSGTSPPLVNAFRYISPAVVTGIAPASGSTAGATPVTITGSGFLFATSAAVGGVNIGAFLVVDDGHITGTTGAHAAGAVNVTVTNPIGTSAPLVGAFTYVAPFNPATLPLTMWEEGSAVPLLVVNTDKWIGTPSAGTSGNFAETLSTTFVPGGTVPLGPTVDGFASSENSTANGGGVASPASTLIDKVTNALILCDNIIVANAPYAMFGMFRINQAQPAAAPGVVYTNATLANCDARWGWYFNDTKVGTYSFTGVFPFAEENHPGLGNWFVCCISMAALGSTVVDVNRVSGTPQIVGFPVILSQQMRFGGGQFNFTASQPNSVDCLEIAAIQRASTLAERQGFYDFCKAKYPSAGLP